MVNYFLKNTNSKKRGEANFLGLLLVIAILTICYCLLFQVRDRNESKENDRKIKEKSIR